MTPKTKIGPANQPPAGTEPLWERSYNERLILTVLRGNGPTPKAEIARMTGLSAQSASVIMRRLEDARLIKRCKPERGKVGQPSIPMEIAADGAFFFGLKVGRRSADMLLVNFLGTIIGRVHLTYRYPEPEDMRAFAAEAAAKLSEDLGPRQRDAIAGLGISIPGYLWEWAETIGEPPEKMAAWRDLDFRALIAQDFDVPVFLQNDASCACGAELVFGSPDTAQNFLYFYVGYFIGAGVVLNGELFTGPTGNAGALGPMRVSTDGSGMQRLIDLASLSKLEAMIVDAGGQTQALWESTSDWALDGTVVAQWIEKSAEGLAQAIVAACSVIDFELVLIDGWLTGRLRDELVARTDEKLGGHDLAGIVRPELRPGTIGPDARSIGAASLPLFEHFQVPKRASATG